MIRLLLDQGLPRAAAGLLSARGIDAIHVADVGMAKATDHQILDAASRDGRHVVTLDADFHLLLAREGRTRPSVIRLRAQGLRAGPLCEIVAAVAERLRKELEEGVAVTWNGRSTRLRRLPIGRK